MTDEAVAAYFVSDEQRDAAVELLTDTELFNGCVQGTANPEAVRRLEQAGLVVESLLERPVEPPPAIGGGGGRFAESLAVAPPAAAPVEGTNAYRLRAYGQITSEQLASLAALGVTPQAFDPPDLRVVLDPAQHAAVGSLPWVVELVPYEAADAMTPELAEMLDRAEEPGLAAALPRSGTFDVFVQREEDLDQLSRWLGEMPGVALIGQTNKRVRFTAPVDDALIAQILARPEVRKLAPYRTPTL